eukprot:s114_g33.t1
MSAPTAEGLNQKSYGSYRRRLQLFAKQCGRRGRDTAIEGASLAVSLLQDAAWEATEQLDLDEVELEDETFKPIFILFDKLYQYEDLIEVPSRCEEFFQDFMWLKNEDLQAYNMRHSTMMKKMREINIDIPKYFGRRAFADSSRSSTLDACSGEVYVWRTRAYYEDEVPEDIEHAADQVEDEFVSYVESRRRMRELALARGFYPVVALPPDGMEKGKGKSTLSGSTRQHGPRFKRYRVQSSGVKEIPEEQVSMVEEINQRHAIDMVSSEECLFASIDTGKAIIDSGARTIVGEEIWKKWMDAMRFEDAKTVKMEKATGDFRFGDGNTVRSNYEVKQDYENSKIMKVMHSEWFEPERDRKKHYILDLMDFKPVAASTNVVEQLDGCEVHHLDEKGEIVPKAVLAGGEIVLVAEKDNDSWCIEPGLEYELLDAPACNNVQIDKEEALVKRKSDKQSLQEQKASVL